MLASDKKDRSTAKTVLFDPQRRAGNQALKDAISAVAEHLETQEVALKMRQRARSKSADSAFQLAVEAIVCNLVSITIIGRGCHLAVPRSSAAMWSKGRYSSPVYGQHFLDILDAMAHPAIGLVTVSARGFGSATGKGRLTTIQATKALSRHLPTDLIQWDGLRREDDPEVLILKGRKDRQSGRAELVDYRDTALTRRMRREIRYINRALAAGRFWIAADAGTALDTDAGLPIDPARRSLRRIFNNASWREGGRLFGGFWETMRREDRRNLRIATAEHPEGEPTVEVDYSALFPRLAYFRAGFPDPDSDLYAFGPPSWSRDGRKRLLNAMLLAERPLRNWPEGIRELFPPGTKFREATEAVRQHHAPLASLLDKGIGLLLMRTESELLIQALFALIARGITALPLHDGIIVGLTDQDAAREAMTMAFHTLGFAAARAKLKTKKNII